MSPRARTGVIVVMVLLLGLLASLAGGVVHFSEAGRPPGSESAARQGGENQVQPYDPLR